MYLYMKVSNDKYEHPVAIAESVRELAEIVGISPKSISSMIYHNKGTYRRIMIEDNDTQ